MEEYNEEDIIDEAEDDLEQSQDLQDFQLDQLEGTVPAVKEQENLYKWFWQVVRLDDPLRASKVGHLNNKEIGDARLTVRDSLNLAYLGNIFNHKNFGRYFANHALITSATSMSRNGWFMDLSISQKKVRERAKTTKGSSTSEDKGKWKLFKKKNDPQEN